MPFASLRVLGYPFPHTNLLFTMPLDTSSAALPRLKGDTRLAALGGAQRIWAIGSIYGRYGALMEAHNMLERRLLPQDRVVYLGNYLGAHSHWTGEGIAVIDELISFRNALIAVPGFFASDVVHLMGQGEDLLRHTRRLPFQKNHAVWLSEALRYGLENYTMPYGTSAAELLELSQQGLHAMNRWCHALTQRMSAHAGHNVFYETLKTAAHTQNKNGLGQAAFVPAGFDAAYSLSMQHDLLCWPEADVAETTRWSGYARVVRGQVFRKEPIHTRRFVLSLDDGAGLEGKLSIACLDSQGQILDFNQFG